MYKIGVLIPTTSAKRNWKQFNETTLNNIFLCSFIDTYCNQYTYTIYLVIDENDPIFSTQETLVKTPSDAINILARTF